jgi:hypothetical protein
MPGFDATGPRGWGPGTGWGRGPCGAGLRRGFVGGWGQGFFGRGGGRGFGRAMWGCGSRGFAWGSWGGPRWGYGPWVFGPSGPGGAYGYESPQNKIQALKEEAGLRSELEALQKRIAELEHRVSAN